MKETARHADTAWSANGLETSSLTFNDFETARLSNNSPATDRRYSLAFSAVAPGGR